jgi:hypothetical protein
MKSHIISGFVGGLIVAAFLAAGIASGAVGDPIRAGQKTIYGGPATNSTELEGSPAAPQPLLILDKNTNGPALRLEPKAGQPALSVSNGVKITNLNADRLDGVDSTSFLRAPVYRKLQSGGIQLNSISPCDQGEVCGLIVSCDDGDVALGGGGEPFNTDDFDPLFESGPIGAQPSVGWFIGWTNQTDRLTEANAFVICSDNPPLH